MSVLSQDELRRLVVKCGLASVNSHGKREMELNALPAAPMADAAAVPQSAPGPTFFLGGMPIARAGTPRPIDCDCECLRRPRIQFDSRFLRPPSPSSRPPPAARQNELFHLESATTNSQKWLQHKHVLPRWRGLASPRLPPELLFRLKYQSSSSRRYLSAHRRFDMRHTTPTREEPRRPPRRS